MIETITTAISFAGFLLLSISVWLKLIPPISLVYIIAKPAEKVALRKNIEEIRFISKIYLLIAVSFIPVFFLTLFPKVKVLEVATYVYFTFLLIYVFYKSIKSETERSNKSNSEQSK